ncbi:MAG TPA: hypothetical protein VKB96_12810 [Gammaproteobacteria bacterium]|nr:hypothetical protein [Gammaproteobacteria bacterium]
MTRAQAAGYVNFNDVDPIEAVTELSGGIGVDRVINVVGVDAVHPN